MEKLLEILSENARVSLEDLAAMLGLAPAEAARMMDECEKNGLIHGYQALVAVSSTHLDSGLFYGGQEITVPLHANVHPGEAYAFLLSSQMRSENFDPLDALHTCLLYTSVPSAG